MFGTWLACACYWNPPKIFIPAKNTETAAIITRLGDPICKLAKNYY